MQCICVVFCLKEFHGDSTTNWWPCFSCFAIAQVFLLALLYCCTFCTVEVSALIHHCWGDPNLSVTSGQHCWLKQLHYGKLAKNTGFNLLLTHLFSGPYWYHWSDFVSPARAKRSIFSHFPMDKRTYAEYTCDTSVAANCRVSTSWVHSLHHWTRQLKGVKYSAVKCSNFQNIKCVWR